MNERTLSTLRRARPGAGWRRRSRVVAYLGALLLALLLTATAAAQSTSASGDLPTIIKFNGSTAIGPAETVSTVIGIRGDVVVTGRVRDTLVVVDGTALITGRVDGDVNVINGTLDLRRGAVVHNVTLVRSDLRQATGATITGSLSRHSGYSFGSGGAIFSFLFWLGMTILVLVAGLGFAAIGGRQLVEAGTLLTDRVGASLLTALILWIGLPILAILVLFTVVGIPLGVAILLFVLPVLWVLGYLVAGARLGAALLGAVGRAESPVHPFLAAVVGLLVFQLIGLIPFLGGLVVFLAGLIGAGALGYLAYRHRGGLRRATITSEAAPVA